MKKAKKKPAVVQAYRLGEDHEVLESLAEQGKIKIREDGKFEVFSQEAKDDIGEIAHEGDYIKFDSSGAPYPNNAQYFEKNHRHLTGEYYEQRSDAVYIWTYKDPMCPEVQYLIDHKQLTLHEDDPKKYFQAPLWGTRLSAAKEAVLVFYRIEKDAQGNITDVQFNFVAGDEFRKTYEISETDERP